MRQNTDERVDRINDGPQGFSSGTIRATRRERLPYCARRVTTEEAEKDSVAQAYDIDRSDRLDFPLDDVRSTRPASISAVVWYCSWIRTRNSSESSQPIAVAQAETGRRPGDQQSKRATGTKREEERVSGQSVRPDTRSSRPSARNGMGLGPIQGSWDRRD